jgi:hypothetical protein
MRHLLAITAIALPLAGCVGNYDKEADMHVCETAIATSQAAASQFFPNSGVNVPARSLLGGGKIDYDDTTTYVCYDGTRDKTSVPQVPNLHKVRFDHLSSAT